MFISAESENRPKVAISADLSLDVMHNTHCKQENLTKPDKKSDLFKSKYLKMNSFVDFYLKIVIFIVAV